MWPFKKKPKNIMKGFVIEITADGSSRYKVFIWRDYHSFGAQIAASKFGCNSYSEAADEAQKMWNDIKAGREKLFGS